MRTTDIAQPGAMTAPPGATMPPRSPEAPPPGQVLASHYDSCLGCGKDHPTGLRMSMVAGEGLTVHGEFAVTDHHQGAPGLAHGGLVAVAMDEVLGGLGWLLRTPMVTGRLQVEYLRPVPVATTLAMEAQVDGVDGRRIYCRATARAGSLDGDLLSRAFAVFVAVPMGHFRRHGRAEEVDAAMRAASARAPGPGWDVNP